MDDEGTPIEPWMGKYEWPWDDPENTDTHTVINVVSGTKHRLTAAERREFHLLSPDDQAIFREPPHMHLYLLARFHKTRVGD